MKFNIVNLTPHRVVNSLSGVTYPAPEKGAPLPRVSSTNVEVLDGFFQATFGEVENLPPQRWGTLYIVSALVRSALPERGDLVSPGEQIRDEKGVPVACKGFNVNPSFRLFYEKSASSVAREANEHWMIIGNREHCITPANGPFGVSDRYFLEVWEGDSIVHSGCFDSLSEACNFHL